MSRVPIISRSSYLTTAWERTTCAPWGLFGGKPGEVGSVVVEPPGGSAISITKITKLPVREGTRVTLTTAGGGGCGDPLERPLPDVENDLRLGYISPGRASSDYGMVLAADGSSTRASKGNGVALQLKQ